MHLSGYLGDHNHEEIVYPSHPKINSIQAGGNNLGLVVILKNPWILIMTSDVIINTLI